MHPYTASSRRLIFLPASSQGTSVIGDGPSFCGAARVLKPSTHFSTGALRAWQLFRIYHFQGPKALIKTCSATPRLVQPGHNTMSRQVQVLQMTRTLLWSPSSWPALPSPPAEPYHTALLVPSASSWSSSRHRIVKTTGSV